jgi:hypothetical protein
MYVKIIRREKLPSRNGRGQTAWYTQNWMGGNVKENLKET